MDFNYKEAEHFRQQQLLPQDLLVGHQERDREELIEPRVNKEFAVAPLAEGRRCETQEDVREDLLDDVALLFRYMKHSIFYVSGIVDYFQQAVDEIKNRFVHEEENSRGWQHLVFKAIDEANPLIPDLDQMQDNIANGQPNPRERFVRISAATLKTVILGPPLAYLILRSFF